MMLICSEHKSKGNLNSSQRGGFHGFRNHIFLLFSQLFQLKYQLYKIEKHKLMSYSIEPKKLKRIIDYYAPYNSGEEMKFMHYLKGEEELYKCLETSPFQGITIDSIDQRIAWFGSNENLSPVKGQSILEILAFPFESFTFKVIFFFSTLCFIAGIFISYNALPFPYFEGLFCLIGLFLTYILMLASHIFKLFEKEELSNYSQKIVECTVWRQNKRIVVMSNEVVVGDIIELNKDDTIVADGWIIEGMVKVEEIVSYQIKIGPKMTMKESINLHFYMSQKQIQKKKLTDQNELHPTPVILSGSRVISGSGKMIVLCVGKYSRRGEFISLIHQSTVEKKKELSCKIEEITFAESKRELLMLIILLLLRCLKFIINRFLYADWKDIDFDSAAEAVIEILSSVLIPSTVSGIFGIVIGLRYLKYQLKSEYDIDVKRTLDCESMASVDTICYQKINDDNFFTLTSWWNEQIENIDENKFKHLNAIFESHFQNSLKEYPAEPSELGLSINSYFIWKDERTRKFIYEVLKEFAMKRAAKNRSSRISKQVPINIIEMLDEDSEEPSTIKYIYGSAEVLLPHFTHLMSKETGKIKQIHGLDREELRRMINQWGLKEDYCLATGYLEIDPQYPNFRDPRLKAVLLSLILYKDNRSREEFEAVTRLQKEGINLIMTTANQFESSISISKQLGLIVSGKASISLKGYDFYNIVGGIICNNCKKAVCNCFEDKKYESIIKNKDQFQRISKHLDVLSQTQFIHKLSLVTGFNNKGNLTCVVGTRKEDIPAMMGSHLSIIFNNEVSNDLVKCSADVCLPENSLKKVQILLEYGRKAHCFIKKYFQLILTSSNVGFFFNFITLICFGGLNIKLIQYIWIHLIICPFLAFALVDEEPVKYQMSSTKKGEKLLSKTQIKFISSQVVFQLCLLLICMFFGQFFFPEDKDSIDEIIGDDWAAKYNTKQRLTVCWGASEKIFVETLQYGSVLKKYAIYSRHNTIIFNIYALMQLFNFFNCRKLQENQFNIFSHFTIRTALFFILPFSFQILCIQFGGQIMGLYPYGLTIKQWAISAGFGVTVWIVCFIVKLLPKDLDHEEGSTKYWTNRSYNLAVMTVTSRETLIQFEVDDDFCMKETKKEV